MLLLGYIASCNFSRASATTSETLSVNSRETVSRAGTTRYDELCRGYMRNKTISKYYFSLRRRRSEIILFRRVETCLKLFQSYFTGLLQLTNIFQHVHSRLNNFRTPSTSEIMLFPFQMWLHVK